MRQAVIHVHDTLRKLLKPPTFEDEEKNRTARVLNAMLLIILGGLAMLLVATLLTRFWSSAAGLSVALIILGGLLWLVRRGILIGVGFALLVTLLGVVTYVLLAGQGIHDVAVMAYCALPTVGSLLLRRRWFIALISLIMLSMALVVVAELSGWLATPFRAFTSPDDLLFLYIVLLIVTFTAWLMANDLRQALTRARKNERDLAERSAALARERDLIERVMDTSPAGILQVDADGQIVYANRRAEQILGLKRGEISERAYNSPSWRITDEAGQNMPDDQLPFAQVKAHRSAVFGVRHAIEQPDGTRTFLSVNAAPLLSQQEEFEGMVAAIEDITERRMSEIKSRIFQEKLQALHWTTFELTQANTLDDLYRAAITLGLSRLGFERLGLFLIDEHQIELVGTYGTDESGGLRDERHVRERVELAKNEHILELLRSNQRAAMQDNAALYGAGARVGSGQEAVAIVWDGFRAIGLLFTDNYLSHQPLPSYTADLLALYGSAIGALIVRKRVEESLRESQHHLESRTNALITVNRIADSLHRSLDLPEVAEIAVRCLIQYMNVISCAVYLLNEGDDYLRLLQAEGVPPDTLKVIQRLPLAGSLAGEAALRRQTVVSDLVADELRIIQPIRQELARSGLKRIVSIPLLHNDRVLGALSVGFETSLETISDSLEVLQSISNTIALAVANAKAVRQLTSEIAERNRAEQALRASEAEVRALNAGLEEHVQQRTAQLEAAIKELEAFAYTISHDLRAPLRAIDGFSRTLGENYLPQLPALAQHYLNRIQHNARRMGTLIDDLLSFSRVGRKSMRFEGVDMNRLAHDVLEELRANEQVGAAEVRIKALPACLGDRSLLRQVLYNLLGNAVKYSRGRSMPRIEVGWQAQNEQTVYYVRDNGIGFDMKYADKLFGVFHRLHNAEEYEGSGIGLAIVRRILERHGGQIWAEGQPDAGAAFFFTVSHLGSAPKAGES